MRKKKLDIGNIVEIFKVTNRSQIRCAYGLGVVVSKTFSGNEYRVKDFTTWRETWYESKDLEDVTETYPHLLTNCCLKYEEIRMGKVHCSWYGRYVSGRIGAC